MAIKKIENLSCSLNLGLIYSLNYSYSPDDGAKISIFFVNESGVYNTKFLSAKTPASIIVGKNSFSMYPISYGVMSSPTRKIIRVDFVDGFFKLDNYYVVLGKTGCGPGIFSLGRPTSSYFPEFKYDTNDKFAAVAKQVKDFTEFEDLEYTWSDFLGVLKRVFSVSSSVAVSDNILRNHTGSFREVLTSWANDLGLSFYFENDIIKIVSPASYNLQFPSVPSDALESNYSESLEGTYRKTASMYVQYAGGKLGANALSESSVALTAVAFCPMFLGMLGTTDQISGLEGDPNNPTEYLEKNMDLVIAAMYGPEVFFLYNYINNKDINVISSVSGPVRFFQNIGFYQIQVSELLGAQNQLKNFVQSANCPFVGHWDKEIFDSIYQKYRDYGINIAGRFYQTEKFVAIDFFSNGSWLGPAGLLSETGFEDSQKTRDFKIVQHLKQKGSSNGDYTLVADSNAGGYPGLFTEGDRLIFKDLIGPNLDDYVLSDIDESRIKSEFNGIVAGPVNSNSVQLAFGQNPSADWIPFLPNDKNQQSYAVINPLIEGRVKEKALTPRFNILNFEYSNQQQLFTEAGFDALLQRISKDDLSYRLMAAPLKVGYNVYIPKYETCVFASQGSQESMGHRFSAKQLSNDLPNEIKATIKKFGERDLQAEIEMNTAIFDKYRSETTLQETSVPKTIPEKSISFSLNYFYALGANAISNGLTSMTVDVSDDGITSSLTFSNKILEIRKPDFDISEALAALPRSFFTRTVPEVLKTI